MRAENVNDRQENVSIAQIWAWMLSADLCVRLVRSLLSESLPYSLLAPFKNAQGEKSLIPKATSLQH